MSCRKSLATLILRVLSSFVNSKPFTNNSYLTSWRCQFAATWKLCQSGREGSITFTICFNS